MKPIETTAIIGVGALGMLFGNQLISNLGPDHISYVADDDRIKKYENSSFTINGNKVTLPLTPANQAKPVDLVIVAVKYTALSSALETMKPCVGPDTTIISVLNGISSEKMIGERFGHDKVIYTIAQGMDAMKFGSDLTYTKPGELCIGIDNPDQQERLDLLTQYLKKGGVPFTVEAEILRRLWGKFMLNVGLNQTCMAYETNYGGVLTPGEAHDTMIGAMREVIALSEKEGINLTEEDFNYYIDLIKTLSPQGMPSMRQDAIARRYSEVEMFAGTVREMSSGYGLAVPVNDRLYNKIKKMEAEY